MTPRSRILAAAGLLACVGALGACNVRGHGKHTSEHLAQAQARIDVLKAGTEWDRGMQQYLAGDLSKALKSVDNSLAINDSVPKSHTLRGRILMELGQLEQALESFKRAQAVDPTFVDAHYYEGIVHERFRDLEAAFGAYQAASALDESDPQHLVAAAEMLIEMDRLEEAEKMLLTRAGVFQHNAGVRQTLGHIAIIQGEFLVAVELFNEARLLAPDDLSVLEDLAMAEIAAGQFAEAEYSLRRLLRDEANEDRRDLRQAQARCLIELDRPVEARQILLQLTSDEAGVNDVRAWIALGEVSLMLEDETRVRLAGQRLARMAPDRHEGHLFLALALRDAGQLEKALASATIASELARHDPAPAMLCAVLARRLGKHDEARRFASLAAAIDPSSVSAQRLMTAFVEDN